MLGGGSNVRFKDRLEVTVIRINIPGIREEPLPGGDVRIHAGAGVNWNELVSYCTRKGYGGIENLALIPVTAGAAPVNNIVAYGVGVYVVNEKIACFV